MSIKKDEYQEREVIENGNVVKYAIPHGRLHTEIVSMTPLSDEKFVQDKVAEVEEIKAGAEQQVAKEKQDAKEQTLKIQQDDNEKKSKEKIASIKKDSKQS